jgi:sec-independent protein translocase protein TatA
MPAERRFTMLGGLSIWELLLIVLVILLLFGAKRLPELAQGLGKGIRDFKRAMKDTGDEVKGSVNDESASSAPRVTPPSDTEKRS